jgi:hypothetical protein
MGKRIAAIGAALILAMALIGVSFAVGSRSTGIFQPKVMTFVIHGGNFSTVDVGPAGDSPGDTFLTQQPLQNFDLTKQLGRYSSACVLETVDNRLNHCTATIFLAHGQIELESRFHFSDTLPGFRLAVVGGTGMYANVVGQAKVTFGCTACPAGASDVDTLRVSLLPSFQKP